jgi:hypothetical protein
MTDTPSNDHEPFPYDFPEPKVINTTTLLYWAEQFLMTELRRERYVREIRLDDPPEGTLRLFHYYPITNESGAWDESKGDPVVIDPGIVYIVKAVTKPSTNPDTGELEFGVQRRHVDTLRQIWREYTQTTPDTRALARVYWHIKDDGQFRYIDIEALDSLGRIKESDNIHSGGTIFIPVYKTAPFLHYKDDPYREARDKFLSKEKRPESTEWFN